MQKATFTDLEKEKKFFRRVWNFRVNYRIQPSFYNQETFYQAAVKEICEIETEFPDPFYIEMLAALVSDIERKLCNAHDKRKI